MRPWVAILVIAIGSVVARPNTAASDQSLPAFPGAEGSGSTATGGRGLAVRYVTNLNDAGPGSFREAVRDGNCTVIFGVSGMINLQSKLDIKASNVTVAGQSAPGGGICLRGRELVISGDNIIVRFLRLRPGDVDGVECDALTLSGTDRAMIDHCSMSWSTDSLNDVVQNSTRSTIQWCILSEPLNDSVHQKGPHGYGTGWGSGRSAANSFHHNLLAHCNSRSPRIGSERNARADVCNNVIYNIGGGWAYGGERAQINFVGNYFKPGPSTERPSRIFRISSPDTRMYLHANFIDGQPVITADNSAGVLADAGIDLATALVAETYPFASGQAQSAEQAYESVLEHAGAVLPRRDSVDERIVADVRSGTGRIIDSQAQVGGWPDLASTPPPADSDGDGMPDDWERKNQLAPDNSDDGAQSATDGYSHLEHYLNELAVSAMPLEAATKP